MANLFPLSSRHVRVTAAVLCTVAATSLSGCAQPSASANVYTYGQAQREQIDLDSAGRVPYEIWMFTGYSYKFVIQSATATSIQTLDNLYPILQNAPTSAPAIPSGGIILWSGSTGSVPSGWYLCDGTNGTPDLRNSFIVGAGNTYAVGATGGTADAIVVSHTHTATSTSTVTDPTHVHLSTGNGAPNGGGAGSALTNGGNSPGYATAAASTGITVATATTNATAGTSGTNQNLPPYYALAYIQKA